MEKVSEADLVKRVKAFITNDNYAGALAVVRGVDAGRIKTPPVLCLIGEVYMHEKQYDKAEEVFLRAYDRSPKNRKVLDLITSLYIEMGEYAEAEYYYKEFISVASRDLHRYILRYRLDKGKGERLSVLIDTLERLKDYEYMEEWAYELAKLYEAAGEEKKCIQECDEIVLWFGHGEYVDQAIALKCKLTGEPLPKMTTVEMQLELEEEAEAAARAKEADTEVFVEENSRPDEDEAPAAAFQKPEDVHVINPDSVLEYTSEEMGIDTDIIVKAMEHEKAQRMAEDSRSNTGLLFEAMGAEAARDLKEDNFEDEEDEDKPEAMPKSDVKAVLSPRPEPDKQKAPVSVPDFKNAKRPVMPDFLKKTGEESGSDPLEELEAMLSDVPDADSLKDTEEEDSEDEEILEVLDDISDEDDLELAEALEGMTEDQDEVLLEQAVFGGLPSGDMLENDLDDYDEVLDDERLQMTISESDEQFLDELFSADEDEVIHEDVAIPQTVKDIFATVPDVKDVHKQLAMTLSQFETTGEDFDVLAPYDINFVVLCDDKSMKSQISIGIAKALNTYGLCDKKKIVKTKAAELNRQDFSMIFGKISGGCLIIERADELSEQSVAIIEEEAKKDNQDVAIVLASIPSEMNKFWQKYPQLRGRFLNVINVSKYNETELVTLAKGYVEQRGYELSPEAALILRDYFKKCSENDDNVGYENVIHVADEGIAALENRNMKNLFMTVLDNKYEEADMLKLLPEDFKGLYTN